MHALIHTLRQERLIGIVRTDSAESCLWASTQLIEAGVKILEIPFTVPDTPTVIETLCTQFPDAIIGAGTVLEARDAAQALGSGAQFLVSPVLLEPLIQLGIDQNILVLPGCATPSEIYKAYSLGATAIKFFPAQAMGGAEFLKAVKAPLPQIPIVPTGGIELEHIPAYLKAGALAIGIGAPMLPNTLIKNRDAKALKNRARQTLQAVSEAAASR